MTEPNIRFEIQVQDLDPRARAGDNEVLFQGTAREVCLALAGHVERLARERWDEDPEDGVRPAFDVTITTYEIAKGGDA